MNLDDWCRQNYRSLLQASKNISQNSDLSEELLHYALEQLLFKTNLQEILDSGGGQFYVIRIMLNSWKSTTSPFYRTYRDYTQQVEIESYLQKNDVAEDPSVDLEPTLKSIKRELETLYWYDKQLFQLFVDEDHSMSSLSRATGIPRTSISLTLNRVRTHLKAKINPHNHE